jgi:uncharacterized protein
MSSAPIDGFGNLPIELFRTERGLYAFDAAAVRFMELDPVAFDLLAVLRERTAELDELISLLAHHPADEVRRAHDDLRELQGKRLLVRRPFVRARRFEDHRYEEVLSRRLAGFTLFVTTRCNLGCSYCIFGGQYAQHEELSETPMPWDTLRAAMDFLALHGRDSESLRLDWFGGEPLLAFDAIKRAVTYLKSIIDSSQRVIVTIASNGTVLTDAILDFCVEHEVLLQFSIDGGRAAHDRHRPFAGSSGRSSFDRILANLGRAHARSPEWFRRCMRLKGVLMTDTVDEDDEEFFSHPLVRIIADEGHMTFLDVEPHYELEKDQDYFTRLERLGQRLLAERGVETFDELSQRLNPKQRALYHHTFDRFVDGQAIARTYFAGRDEVPFTKGCMTGYQEGAVDANGDISVCLKSAKGENLVIGNVVEGRFYFDKIRDLNARFHEDWAGCSSCFVQRLCDMCYEKLDGEPGRWASSRAAFCAFNRERHRRIFECMLQVMENNPSLWDDLSRVLRNARPVSEPEALASHDLFDM